MSLLEEAQGLERKVAARLRELEPLVSEYGELRALAERLGIETPAADPAPARAASARPPRAAGRPKPTRKAPRPAEREAARVNRSEDVLRLITENPGTTVAEIGKRLGVDPTSLYRVVRRLEQQGRVSKSGRAIHPA